MTHRPRQRARILARLRLGRATTADLCRIAWRAGARVHELRKAGHRITAKPLPGGSGLWEYRLVGG